MTKKINRDYLICKDCNYKWKIDPNELPNGTPCPKCSSSNTVKEIHVGAEDTIKLGDSAK